MDELHSSARPTLATARRWSARLWTVSIAALILALLFALSPFRDFVESLRGAALMHGMPHLAATEESLGAEGQETMSGYKQTVRAPDFTGAVGWLNVAHPLTMKELRGKVVLLDFWTYCCINCMHIIPDLKRLEHQYGNALAVIGVHSAKFQNEKDTHNIREAILRYDVEHPVVNDAKFSIWRSYGVQAWPTLVLIDPDGYVVGEVSGEGNYAVLDRAIGQLVEKYRAAGKLNLTPLPLALEKYKQPPSVLSFPGKILADSKSQRLFISDSDHNRIVITDLAGKVLDIASSGAEGKSDGDFAHASFHHPQGMALDPSGNVLWVADTENHLIRKLDLKARTVETVAGTGVEASFGAEGGPALSTALNSPWDLTEVDGKIYIAMAGCHQLWVHDPAKKTVEPFAGSGMENIADGPLRFASLAQPSGITNDGRHLFFADSEASAVRYADLGKPHQVHTIIGEGLFEFGDKDGAYPDARLQHPLGVLYHDGKLFVADTYNHKIKIVDPEKKTVETFLGVGKPGLGTETHPQFYEPGGLAIAGGKLFIADTDNNDVRVADLKTKRVTTLQLTGMDQFTSAMDTAADDSGSPFLLRQSFSPRSVKPGVAAELLVDLKLPEGYHLNPLAPLSYHVKKIDGDGVAFANGSQRTLIKGAKLPITIPFKSLARDGHSTVELAMTVYYCRTDNQGLCYIKSLDLMQPIDVAASSSETSVPIKVELK